MTHCLFQTLAVLNPLKQTDHSIMQDTDLAGPLVFCLAFGGSLMLVSFPLKGERGKQGRSLQEQYHPDLNCYKLNYFYHGSAAKFHLITGV